MTRKIIVTTIIIITGICWCEYVLLSLNFPICVIVLRFTTNCESAIRSICADFSSSANCSVVPLHWLLSRNFLSRKSHSTANLTNNPIASCRRCRNCQHLREQVSHLLKDVHELEEENISLMKKLSDLNKIFERMKRDVRDSGVHYSRILKSPNQPPNSPHSSHGMTSPSTSCSSVSCTSKPHGKMNMTTGSSANMSSSADVVEIPPTKQQPTDSTGGANSSSVSSDTGMFSGSTGSNNMSSTSNTNETVTYHQRPHPLGSIDGPEGEGNMEDEGKQNTGRRENGRKIDDDAIPLPSTTCAISNATKNSTTRPVEKEVVTLRIKLEEREYAFQGLLTKYQRRKERHREDVRRMRLVDV